MYSNPSHLNDWTRLPLWTFLMGQRGYSTSTISKSATQNSICLNIPWEKGLTSTAVSFSSCSSSTSFSMTYILVSTSTTFWLPFDLAVPIESSSWIIMPLFQTYNSAAFISDRVVEPFSSTGSTYGNERLALPTFDGGNANHNQILIIFGFQFSTVKPLASPHIALKPGASNE